MCNKKCVAYYRIGLMLDSALSIGATDSVETDNDVVRDGRGLPLIPATSLAGVFRSYFSPADARAFFGKLVDDGGDLTESVVRVYDGTWVAQDEATGTKSNVSVSVRDGIRLEEGNKVVATGLKFDRQIVERGAVFCTMLEVTDCSVESGDGRSVLDSMENMLGALDSGALALGGKTSRGLGKVSITSCKRAVFNLADSLELDEWLAFNPFEGSRWRSRRFKHFVTDVELCESDANDVVFELDLNQRGAVSIREYSTEPGRPDFEQLHVRDTRANGMDNDVPVIPGTSWAGAFRDRYRAIAGDGLTRNLFGDVWKDESSGETQAKRSRIEFSETELAGGEWKDITRNSIDRFTGGTKDHALFKMRTYYGGSTRLVIRIRCADESWGLETLEPLIVCLADLHNGLLSVGGLTAVGHGLFRIADVVCKVGGHPIEGIDFREALLGNDEYAVPDVAGIAQRMATAVTGMALESESL